MTDLRTRIAQALWDFACPDALKKDYAKPGRAFLQMADAVIADLDSRGWLIDPESEDRRRRARNKRWPEGNDDHD